MTRLNVIEASIYRLLAVLITSLGEPALSCTFVCVFP